MDFIEIGRRTLSNEKIRHMSLSNLLCPSYIKVFRSYFNLLSFIYFNLLSFTFNYPLSLWITPFYFDLLLISFIYLPGRVCWSSVSLRGPNKKRIWTRTRYVHTCSVCLFMTYLNVIHIHILACTGKSFGHSMCMHSCYASYPSL